MASAATTGHGANAATGGYGAHAATTGHGAHATTTGHGAHATTTGDGAIACALGDGCWARAGESGMVILIDRTGDRHRALVAYPGEDGIEPGRWCCIEDGRIVQPADVLDIDRRGYVLRYVDGRYVAGCREFDTANEAVAHWSDPGHPDPESARILREAVQRHHAATEGASS
jgi:hypothetical protein